MRLTPKNRRNEGKVIVARNGQVVFRHSLTVVGQFYLAVLVAEIIGKRVSQTISDQQSDSIE
jgi:hypothetical protein